MWCIGGVFTEVRCDGQDGCKRRGLTRGYCDQAVSQVGQPCIGPEGGAACSPEGNAFLRCRGGRMVLDSRCRGPRGCYREGNMGFCDETIAVAGDPCGSDDGAACSTDGLQVLDCVDGLWTLRYAVESCRAEDGLVNWTHAHVSGGERCEGDVRMCSDDGRMLACRDGQLAPYLECRGPRGCYPDGEVSRCDQSFAIEGDTCAGSYAACSTDHTAQLRCRGGVFVHEQRCMDCNVRSGTVYCHPFVPRPHR